jgi:putative membrane protein
VPLIARSAFGGALMGLANLVPGISGGTMLLAAGVYPRFINAIGELTRLTVRLWSVVTLLVVVASALIAIGVGAGPVKDLVVEHRWAMYALFIGLTLGGVPVVWRLIDRKTPGVFVAAAAGLIAMAALALAQSGGASGAADTDAGWLLFFLAGVAGASAMILPGVSGGYLLLVLGVYLPLLAAIDAFKAALLDEFDLLVLRELGLRVMLPVGLGVVIGVVAVSNVLKLLLDRAPRPTLGFLLGLLLGAVVGLYPFVQAVPPEHGDTVKGRTVRVQADGFILLESPVEGLDAEPLDKDDWPTATFTPGVATVAAAMGLIAIGFGVTLGVDRLGREKPARPTQPD